MSEAPALTTKQRQSRATRERLLAAATEEFQRHGLAGGRVDRIAEASASNKRLIYIYFGDKEGLFDAVVARHVEVMLDAVPMTADDLPRYAADLLAHLEDHPEVARLFAYRNLERPVTSPAENASYERKVSAIREAQQAGHLDDSVPAVQLLAMVLGLVGSWAVASPALREAADRDVDHGPRDQLVRRAVRRLSAPGAGDA